MNISTWILNINMLDDTYLLNKHHLTSFLEVCTSKYLILYTLEMNTKIKNIIKNYSYVLVWDCEFQVFKTDEICKYMIPEYLNDNKMLRCISELGCIILLNIKNKIYLGGMIHCSFLNNRLNKNITEYLPFYHEYLSTTTQTENMIINIEKKLFPHQMFTKLWQDFIKSNNTKNFTKNVIKLLNLKLLKSNSLIYNKFKQHINHLLILLETTSDTYNEHVSNLVSKIITNLKNIIYAKTIKYYNNNNLFKLILDLYLNDDYAKKIMIPINNHKQLIYHFNALVKDLSCINIIKGMEDLKALNNHNIFINNCKNIGKQNIIDIASYNTEIYKLCSSAKLYESYMCLMDKTGKYDAKIENKLKLFTDGTLKPHNPLVDAYYTLFVFIQFNSL